MWKCSSPGLGCHRNCPREREPQKKRGAADEFASGWPSNSVNPLINGTMSTTETQTPLPTITNAGTTPGTRHKLFVNIPVEDVQRAITFFEALDFSFNPQFTDATATCMLVGEDAYFMLLDKERFKSFTKRPLGDAHAEVNAIYALSVDSREKVDEMVQRAERAGGTALPESTDHGFMYEWGFSDLDGHYWGVFWMEPAALQG